MNNSDHFEWRNQGKRIQIGKATEDEAISEMFVINNRMHFITNANIYKIKLADDTDPERKNPYTPDIQQKVIGLGSDSELVGRTLLQAKVVFCQNHLSQNIKIDRGLSAALSFLLEAESLQQKMNDYIKTEDKEIEDSEKKLREDGTLLVPSFTNIQQLIKSFILNTNHAIKHMTEVANAFYPEIGFGPKNYKALHDKMIVGIGPADPRAEAIRSIGEWVWLLRDLRNAVEHPKDGNIVTVTDFTLDRNNTVAHPSISHEGRGLQTTAVRVFLNNTFENLINSFEQLLVSLSSINTRNTPGMEKVLIFIPEEEREQNMRHVSFLFKMILKKDTQ